MTELNETSWQERLSRDLDANYGAFIEANQEQMCRIAASFRLDRAATEECVEEAFVAVYRCLYPLSPERIASYKIVAYLTVAVQNRAKDAVNRRAEQNIRELSLPNESQDQGSAKESDLADMGAFCPELLYLEKEGEEEFYELLKRNLPPETVIMLIEHFVHGFSYKELAKKYNFSANTIKSKITRGIHCLRNSQDIQALKETR
ncbi:MAG TPA: sigma-70 family RNA polymerase sigma factor [Ktedonobacteraceae bacterium]